MRLYYTTKAETGAEVKESFLSLGGYISGTPVPNNVFGALFSSITPYTIENDSGEFVGLILKNELPTTVTDVLIYFKPLSEVPYSKYKLAAIDTSGTAPDEYMESIDNTKIQPLYGDFEDALESAPINIGGLASGEKVGIWIKRELLIDEIKADIDNLIIKDTETSNQYKMNELEKSELIDIYVSWTD